MTLRLVLDSYKVSKFDFGVDINFKIYQEDGETAFDASGWDNAKVKVFKRHGERFFVFRDVAKALEVRGLVSQIVDDIDVEWDTQASGIGHFKFTETKRPSIFGFAWVEIEGTKNDGSLKQSTEMVRINVSASEGV